jgi:hypothetical protein
MFEYLARFHDIFIFNAGAHYSSTSVYKEDMKQLRQILEPYQKTRTILFRTTPRGHCNCSSTDKKILSPINSTEWEYFFPSSPSKNETNQLYVKYHYDLFPQYNEIMRTQMQGFGATVLEAALQAELRPDDHMHPPRDCLHYKPNHPVFLEWCRLVQNAIKGQLA